MVFAVNDVIVTYYDQTDIRLKSLRDLPGNDAKQRADHIHADAEKLKGQAAEVRVELFAQLNLFRAELQKVRAEQGLIEAEDDFLKRLVSLFADEKAGVAQHAMLLRELQRKLPKSPRAIQVESVLKDRPLWEALLAWSARSDLWRKETRSGLSVNLSPGRMRCSAVRISRTLKPRWITTCDIDWAGRPRKPRYSPGALGGHFCARQSGRRRILNPSLRTRCSGVSGFLATGVAVRCLTQSVQRHDFPKGKRSHHR
ncbi:MAG: hypothetical protein FJ271_22990 [Planctomycetes bacterium]|nr:hypothetical protein [Planctomycetota bacterium]